MDKAKPAARWGRKATGLSKDEKIAGLPIKGAPRFFYAESFFPCKVLELKLGDFL
jgi:hypothetical protein